MKSDVTISRLGDTLTVDVHETLMLETAPDVRAALEDIDEFEPAEVVVDVSTVTEVDSSGLAAVVRLHRAQRVRGHRLTVVGSTPQLKRIFAITRLDRVLRVRESRDCD